MSYLFANKLGFKSFRIKSKGRLYNADRFGFFWSNSGECYVLCFQVKLSHNQTFQNYVALKSTPYGDDIVSRCCSILKKRGTLNIDKVTRGL